MGRTCIKDHRIELAMGRNDEYENGCAQCEIESLRMALEKAGRQLFEAAADIESWGLRITREERDAHGLREDVRYYEKAAREAFEAKTPNAELTGARSASE